MKRYVVLTGICAAGSTGLVLALLLWNNGKHDSTPFNPGRLEGYWTYIYDEYAGEFFSYVRDQKALFNPFARDAAIRSGGEYVPILFKIFSATIEAGPDNDNFPVVRFGYRLHPGTEPAAIDFFPLNEEDIRVGRREELGIYSLKDDFLIICKSESGEPRRPEGSRPPRIRRAHFTSCDAAS